MKFSCYLFGIHFYIETDHRNLLWIDHSSDPKVQRMNLRLSEFNYTILHIPRELNQIANWFRKYCIKTINFTETVFKDSLYSNMTILEVLTQVHNAIIGHHGIHRTMNLYKRIGIKWTSIRKDVEEYIKSCSTC